MNGDITQVFELTVVTKKKPQKNTELSEKV